MKGSSMNTHMGKIVVHNEVIAQYAGGVAVECFGIVGMAGVSVKDGLVKLLKMDSITRGITVTLNKNNKLILDLWRQHIGRGRQPDQQREIQSGRIYRYRNREDQYLCRRCQSD